ncbi:MAG TPA: mucoidy inhibitor MuiA family protein [Puia sp.]
MRPVLFLITLIFSISSIAQVKKLTAETTVSNVTIFSSGARVERSSIVNIQAGRTEISFTGLSNQLEQQTVQLKADANITMLSIQTNKDYSSVRKIDQEEKDLIGLSSEAKDKLNQDTRLLDVYKNEETMLIKNQVIGGQAGVKASDLKESLDLQRQRLTEVYGKQTEIQKRLIADQHEFEKAQLQLGEISKKKDSVNNIIYVLMESKETRTVNFQLQYNVKDAGWYPTYDVRVDEVTKPLDVLMNANVFQRSGETWKNVSLLLSTGTPNDNATPSPIQPWTIGFYDPSVSIRGQVSNGTVSGRITDDKNQPVSGATVLAGGGKLNTLTDENGFFKLQNVSNGEIIQISSVGFERKVIVARSGYYSIALDRASTSLNDVVVTGYATSSDLQGSVPGVAVSRNMKRKTESLQTVSVITQFQPTTTVFKIDDKYTLETDGKTTTIGIKQFDVPSQYDYYSAPKIDPSVFLTAKIVNWQDYDLQSGEVSLYFEGTYLGKTYLDLGAAADTISLSLGKDNGIKVSRKLVKEYSSRKFIGANRTETKDYEISVYNSKHVPVTLRIVDQFPLSTNKEINVDDVKAPEAQSDKETGILNWVISAQPGQEKKLQFGYSVKYPRDRTVVLE